MLKEITIDKLMCIDFLGKSVIIETIIGGITERISGNLHKQVFAGSAEMITLNVSSGFYMTGLDTIKKVYLIKPDVFYVCPECRKVCIWEQWVALEVPDVLMTVRKHCPECAEEIKENA